MSAKKYMWRDDTSGTMMMRWLLECRGVPLNWDALSGVDQHSVVSCLGNGTNLYLQPNPVIYKQFFRTKVGLSSASTTLSSDLPNLLTCIFSEISDIFLSIWSSSVMQLVYTLSWFFINDSPSGYSKLWPDIDSATIWFQNPTQTLLHDIEWLLASWALVSCDLKCCFRWPKKLISLWTHRFIQTHE